MSTWMMPLESAMPLRVLESTLHEATANHTQTHVRLLIATPYRTFSSLEGKRRSPSRSFSVVPPGRVCTSKVNRGNSEYTYKKIVRLHTLLTIIEPFYARGLLTLRTISSIRLIASRLRSRPRGHNILSYAEIT